MSAKTLPTDNDWEQLQRQLGAHFLQSDRWAEFQESVGEVPIQIAGDDGGWSCQGFFHKSGGFSYLYCPYGPTVQAAGKLAEVANEWKNQSVDFVRFEPMGGVDEDEVKIIGAKSSIEIQPSHTVIVDLTKDEEALRSDLSSGHRNAVNGADRRGLAFREGGQGDLPTLLELLHKTAGRQGFRPHPDEYYRKMTDALMPAGAAKIYLAEAGGQAVAGAVVFDYNGTRMYAHAASDPETRQLQAAVPLVWHMMTEAKIAGLQKFDLWGVAPAGAASSHPWAGFSQFKRAFGGQEVRYAGTWDLPLKPARYQAYRAARLVNRMVRR